MIVAALSLSIAAFCLCVLAFGLSLYAIIETRAAQKSTHTMVGNLAPIGDAIQSQAEFDREMARAEDGSIGLNFGDDE